MDHIQCCEMFHFFKKVLLLCNFYKKQQSLYFQCFQDFRVTRQSVIEQYDFFKMKFIVF